MQGKEKIDHFQAYLGDLWTKVASMKQQGLTWQQTAEQIDMTSHSNNYPQIRGPGTDPRAIRRIYELMDN
jgi:cyclase